MYKTWHPVDQEIWQGECMRWYGEILAGDFCHYCIEWDDLPIDETCPEFAVCKCTIQGWDMEKAKMHREALNEEWDRHLSTLKTEDPVVSYPLEPGSDPFSDL